MTARYRPVVRRARSRQWAIAMLVAMTLTPAGNPIFIPVVQAQQQVAPVSQGFNINAEDLRFIYQQILVAQDHAAGGTLLGPGPNQVSDPQLPRGLRTVDGSFNNLVPGQNAFGRADRVFRRKRDVVLAEDWERDRLPAAGHQQLDRRSDGAQSRGRRRGGEPVRLGRIRLFRIVRS